MQRVRLSFRLGEDDHFIVTAEAEAQASQGALDAAETTYDHEDSFLRLLIAADLDEDTTRRLVVAVVLSVANPTRQAEWVPVSISPGQFQALGLKKPDTEHKKGTSAVLSDMFSGIAEHFSDFLMNAPTPFVMLTGPEHTISFINDPYVKILARESREQLLGLPVLEAIPELKGQPCLCYLQSVYETGMPQVRREMLNHFFREETGKTEEIYFDIVYHPLRDNDGNVNGIMAQATDVTERVLTRQVSEHREQKLYRLWSELEAIYNVAPVGIAVIDATDLRMLRLNRLQASFLGGTMQELTARLLTEIGSVPKELLALLKRAASGEKVTDVAIEMAAESGQEERHSLSVSVRPSLNTVGAVETITMISLDLKTTKQRRDVMAEQMSTS